MIMMMMMIDDDDEDDVNNLIIFIARINKQFDQMRITKYLQCL